MIEIPYGDPEGMRRLAAKLWPLAEQVAGEAAALRRAIYELRFEAPVALWYRERAAERARLAERQGVAMRELAGFLLREANALEQAQQDARRRIREAEERARLAAPTGGGG